MSNGRTNESNEQVSVWACEHVSVLVCVCMSVCAYECFRGPPKLIAINITVNWIEINKLAMRWFVIILCNQFHLKSLCFCARLPLSLPRVLSFSQCHTGDSIRAQVLKKKFRFYWHLFRQIAYHKWKHQYTSRVLHAHAPALRPQGSDLVILVMCWRVGVFVWCMCVCVCAVCARVYLWILLQFEVLASLFSKKFLYSPPGTKHYQFWQPTKWLWQDKIDLSVWMWKMFVCVSYIRHDVNACVCLTAFKSFLFYLRVCVCVCDIDLINDNKYILNSHSNLNSFHSISFHFIQSFWMREWTQGAVGACLCVCEIYRFGVFCFYCLRSWADWARNVPAKWTIN